MGLCWGERKVRKMREVKEVEEMEQLKGKRVRVHNKTFYAEPGVTAPGCHTPPPPARVTSREEGSGETDVLGCKKTTALQRLRCST